MLVLIIYGIVLYTLESLTIIEDWYNSLNFVSQNKNTYGHIDKQYQLRFEKLGLEIIFHIYTQTFNTITTA